MTVPPNRSSQSVAIRFMISDAFPAMPPVTGKWRHMFLKQNCWLALLALALLVSIKVEAADVPLSTLHPTDVFGLEPGADATPVPTKVQLPTGGSHPALQLSYQSRITYDISPGTASFSGILYRVDALPAGSGGLTAADTNRIRVRFILDGKVAYDTVLDVTMPPEQLAFPVAGARKFTIAVDQMLSGGVIYLADAVFSSQPAPSAVTSHLLLPGSGYANVGSGTAQVALRVYHPGETVPLRLEFAGAAASGAVTVKVAPNQGRSPTSLTVPVALHAGPPGTVGDATWKVPSVLGPAHLDFSATINGKQVYQRSLNIAIARQVDLSKDSPLSTFGVHLTGDGFPLLTDFAANLWGAKWARVFLRWEVAEYTQGHYDWRRIDELVNIYLAQNMEVMGVLGELAPKWAAPSGPETMAAFNRFVQAAVAHFQNKIRYWDVYNEVDSKYYGGRVMQKNDPTADIRLLRDEMETIRKTQPAAQRVCCSTGSGDWLVYDKRLYENGLLNLMDIVSLHPYQSGPPELKDGAFTYLDMIAALRDLEHGYGANKPVWSTEANWLIGPEEERGVVAPDVDEHGQSKFLVRVNLLSMALGVPYFAHSPFWYPFHRELLHDSVASYANMTYNLGNAHNARMLNLPDGVYGVTASTSAGTICVLWTTQSSARARVSGMSGIHMQDLYGNPASYDPSTIPLSGDPIYIVGNGAPAVTILQVAPAPAAKPLPDLKTWSKAPTEKYDQTASGIRVTTNPTNYGNLLKSPKISVSPNSCYLVSATVQTSRGGVALLALDGTSGQRITSSLGIFTVTGHDEYKPELKIKSGSSTEIQLLFVADNPTDQQVSEFEISHPQISPCYGEQVKH